MLNYSFIIPHHNTPDLLNRCLDSIPQREDIEIIVVDDNSDVGKKPQVVRPDVKLIYIDAEHTKGAGRARNYALKKAKGKWLVFADADDFFIHGFMNVFDQYKDKDLEVIYHDAQAVDTHTLTPIPRLLKRNNGYFERYDGSKDIEDVIRFRMHAPWRKMVRRDFIELHQIYFEEVPKGNDTFFTYQVGFFARQIAVEREKLYVYTFNPDGITNGKKSKEIYLNQLRNRMKSDEFFRFILHPEWVYDNRRLWFDIIRRSGFAVFFNTFFEYMKYYSDFCSTKTEYVESIKARINENDQNKKRP